MNVPVKPPPSAPLRHGFIGADVLRMQEAGLLIEDGKFELIDGEIIDMPSEGETHLGLRIRLNRFLARELPDEIAMTPDGTLRLADKDWPEPDFYLFPASIRVSEARGPDLLLLIEVSDTALAHDMHRKAALYRQYGVREYWVIDVNAAVVHVHRLAGAWPAAPVPLTTALTPSLIPGLSLRIADFLPV
jgi:Uma2 family endonuclease